MTIARVTTVRPRDFAFATGRVGNGIETWTLMQTDSGLAIRGVKGTWIKPKSNSGTVIALVCCPSCANVMFFARGIQHVRERSGRVLEVVHCPCGFQCMATLQEWNGNALYCCKFWERLGGKEVLTTSYMHARSMKECETRIRRLNYVGLKIIAIGLVVGYYQTDEKSDKVLSTEAPKETAS